MLFDSISPVRGRLCLLTPRERHSLRLLFEGIPDRAKIGR
jgi:hypothetical protein